MKPLMKVNYEEMLQLSAEEDNSDPQRIFDLAFMELGGRMIQNAIANLGKHGLTVTTYAPLSSIFASGVQSSKILMTWKFTGHISGYAGRRPPRILANILAGDMIRAFEGIGDAVLLSLTRQPNLEVPDEEADLNAWDQEFVVEIMI